MNEPVTITRADGNDGVMIRFDANDVISDINSGLEKVDILDGGGKGTIIEVKSGRSVSISGVVYLGTGAYITIKNKLCSTKLKVKCENSVSGTIIAKGSDYLITADDLDNITVDGQQLMLDIFHNQIILI